MLQLPNQPARRIWNYASDRDVLHRRWVRTAWPLVQVNAIQLPVDDTTYPKSIDPNWRRSWKEVLLLNPDHTERFWPVIRQNGKAYTTWFPIKTSLFRMRIGPDSTELVVKGYSLKWSTPVFYYPNEEKQPLVVNQAEMQKFVSAEKLRTTRV